MKNDIGKLIEYATDEQEEAISALFEADVSDLVTLCRKYFKTLGTVPRLSTEDENLVLEIVQFKSLETRRYFSFDNAFEIVNNWPLDDLDPTIYVHRPKGRLGDRHVEASQYHLPADDDTTLSRCRAIKANENGYILTIKPKPLMLSRVCTNCLHTKTIKE